MESAKSANIDLKKTVHLPKTDFSMKANLGQMEPRLLAQWDSTGLYRQIREARQGKPAYVLHELLKDFIVKVKTMEGYDSPYVPGWDCHGLPIEHKVESELGSKRATMS